jgi:hypothetical protein
MVTYLGKVFQCGKVSQFENDLIKKKNQMGKVSQLGRVIYCGLTRRKDFLY